MRLAPAVHDDISAIARAACAGQREITLPASSAHRAREMFAALSPAIEAGGGQPLAEKLVWQFGNGSTVSVEWN